MKRIAGIIRICTVLSLLLLACSPGFAADGDEKAQKAPKGPPPMLVAAGELEAAQYAPETEVVGTIYYIRKAKLAAEVGGLVQQINIAEGQKIDAGKVVVLLKTDLLDLAIAATRASHEQVLVELEKAKKDLSRIETLYKEESIAESIYDDHLFKLRGLEKKGEALRAELNRQLLERDKMTIQAPFGGIVMRKVVEEGEWVGPGGTVAVVGDTSNVYAEVGAPQHLLGHLRRDRALMVVAGGREYTGRFIHFIPEGDVATRTFAVKVRLDNPGTRLVEGMEARVKLPTGEASSALFAPRDAVIEKFGKQVVFVVEDTSVKMVPVRVDHYDGIRAAIRGEGLEAGDRVVTKGNERLRDGQAVRFR